MAAVTVVVNGTQYSVPNTYTETSLNEFLRKNLLLSGTKVLCREGGCGICVVYVEYPDPAQAGVTVKRSINSCLCPILSCDGWSITTVEGTGNRNAASKIQQQLTKFYGTQCGYCTPGMIMNMHGLAQKYSGSNLTRQIVEDSFDGNMCRCTGYRPILDAFKSLASDSESTCRIVLDVEDTAAKPIVCPTTGLACSGKCPKPHDGQMAILNQPGGVADPVWYQPTSLNDLYKRMLLLEGKKIFYVAGHTSVGVYDDGPYDAKIDTKKVPELYLKNTTPTSVTLGANVTMTDIIDYFNQAAGSFPQFRYLATLAAHVKKIAGTPVRNAATWAGSLMIKRAHPDFPSDVFLCWELAQAAITIDNGSSGSRAVVTPLQLLTTNMEKPLKIIVSAAFPALTSDVIVRTYKVMPRSQNAHALVNAGFRAQINTSQSGKFICVQTPTLIFGNINGSFNHATQTETYLSGKDFGDVAVLKAALAILSKEIVPVPVPGEASPTYKNSLGCTLFYKFALEIVGNLAPPRFRSAVGSLIRPISSGVQSYPTTRANFPVTQPIPKIESLIQCTGEAKYISDIESNTMLYAAFAVAEQGNADIVKIDGTAAMTVTGVLRVITAMDIPGVNNFNPVKADPEELLATSKALFAGQPVAIVVGTSQQAAENGAKLVKVTFANVKTPILTCQDAIAASSFFPAIADFAIGDAPNAVKNAPNKVKGALEIGSQLHFHMETQVAVCTPTEDGMDVESGTQWVDSVQEGIAQCLGMKKNLINVAVKRVGGAFGGKITRSNIVASAAAVAAQLMKKPVKMFLSLWDNAKIVGHRNPYYVEYEAGFDQNGKLGGLVMNAYADCGVSANDSPVSALTMWGDNAYLCPNWKISMTNCKTNLPANTWTRAPGSTEAIFFIEYIMEHIAQSLNKLPMDVKRANYYKNGDQTITGQIITDCTIAALTDQFLTSSAYMQRLQDVTTFNQNNRWRKRGISITPMKYGATWNGNLFNCLISIFHSGGTVAVSHGGSEIGQGINTKVAQAVAFELGISMDMVSIKPNFSLTNANATPTGGSITSELVCLAALDCCKQLNDRIAPVRASMPGASWADVIEKCYGDGVDLSARSWVAPKTEQQPVYYNTYGLTCTEVELDVLTGENQIIRLDVVHDCGESISPFVDIGQIEGAVVMGLGYFTSEELVHDKTSGQLVTFNTWKYKPPTTKDIPIDFRVEVLQNSRNPAGVLRSKLVAEPPLCMTCSVVFALREACKAARAEIAPGPAWFRIDAPMTVEKVQQYCLPDLSQFTYG